MKTILTFEVDSENENSQYDVKDLINMLQMNRFRVALWEVQQKLRTIYRHSNKIEEDFNKFYENELNEIVGELLDEY